MLAHKPTDLEGKIVTLKLVTDQNQLIEAIGQYIGRDDHSIFIKDLQALVPQQTEDGKMGMGFMQFMLLGKKEAVVELNRATVASIIEASDAATAEYKKYASPIETQNKKFIV